MTDKHRPLRVLVVGGGAREHAIGEALCRTRRAELLVVAHNENPGLARLSRSYGKHDEKDTEWIATWAQQNGADFAVIGLEDSLAAGLADTLTEKGIPAVGPVKKAAQIETSKLFTRSLMTRHGVPGQVEYHHFTDVGRFRRFLQSSPRQYALKPVGLTAGKGVKIMGEHFASVEEAQSYGEKVIRTGIGGSDGLIVEEKLVGEEFTLQTFVDGNTVVPMPLVQDFKRAFEGDTGPNTGSMGSYSQPDGLLPFVTQREYDQALEIMRAVVRALKQEGIPYSGILYGQFIATEQGIKLIEFNARFGDPEAVNVLPLLESDFVDVCRAIVSGTLHKLAIRFAAKATVCKYITPPGYGSEPEAGVPLKLDMDEIDRLGAKTFYAKVNQGDGVILTTSSRAIALVGIADSVEQAEALVEQAASHVHGRFYMRHDIAKAEMLRRKMDRWKAAAARP